MTPGGSPHVFFSFDYEEDKNRAETVFQSLRAHAGELSEAGFGSSAIWQQTKDQTPDVVMPLLRDAIGRAHVTCVLVGAHTWEREWIRNEIAQSLGRATGLLAVRINGIVDKSTQRASAAGRNPLAYMGLGKSRDGQYFIYENSNAQWIRFQEEPLPIAKPSYVADMSVGYVQPITVGVVEYDYVKQDGAQNLPTWIERAAEAAGKLSL